MTDKNDNGNISKTPYEPPRLFDLGGVAHAQTVQCRPGGSATSQCKAGTFVGGTTDCIPGGSAVTACATGTTPATDCTNGGTAGSGCVKGTTAGGGCAKGTSASGCAKGATG